MSETKRIETEIKFELSADEFAFCAEKLPVFGYHELGTFNFSDYFFDIKRFQGNKYDFTRVRVIDDHTYEMTKKLWKTNEKGEPYRIEEEKNISKEEFEAYKTSQPYLSCNKKRKNFEGKIMDILCVFSLDSLEFSDEKRFFIECELDGVSEIDSHSIRNRLKREVFNLLNLSDRDEGIGMMALVLQKAEVEI